MDPATVAILSAHLDDLTNIVYALLIVGGPIWLVAQIVKSRTARRPSTADVALIEKIAEIADRIDRRMAAVEQILDSDTPAWRRTGTPKGDQYERKLG